MSLMRRTTVLDGVPKLGGWIASVSNVTTGRALDTNYQNITGRPLLVLVFLVCNDVDGALQALARVCVSDAALTGCTAAAAKRVCGCGIPNVAGGSVKSSQYTLSFVVPASYHYYIETDVGAGNSVTLFEWWEVTL